MQSEFSIREAKSSDLATLVALTAQEATETEGAEPDLVALKRGVAAGLKGSAPVKYWVAESRSGQVVGSISVVTEWSNFRGGYYWWIQSLFIVPEQRGTGLVDLMLDAVANLARVASALDLRLYVLRSNIRAVAAYRRCGFNVVPYAIMTKVLQ